MWESEFETQEGKGFSNCVVNPLKQGMKAEAFERRGRSWYVATDYPSDLVLEIQDVSFHLHKIPLLSRSGKLNRVMHDHRGDTEKDYIKLDEIPGGAESFELAAKFCYGVAVDLNASNISGLRCAAEYLEMTEDLDEGNLIFKTEAFLSYVVLSSWRDSIIVLKSCEELSPWAENLQIVRRCSESIAWKACSNTRGVKSWSYKSQSRSPSVSPHRWSDMKDSSPSRQPSLPPNWWFEDVSILRIDHFVRVLTAIKVKGMRFDLIGASIVHYASKWLPAISKDQASSTEDVNFAGGLHLVVASGKEDVPKAQMREQRLIVESLISIIPPQKDTVSCSFLLHLLKLANMLDVAPALVTELEKRIGMQLDQATLKDLLIPSYSKTETIYDVDVMCRLLEHFLVQEQSNEPPSPSRSTGGDKLGGTLLNAKMRVARLVDSYLTEVSRDRNLSLTKFQVLAEALPESARTSDDGLYRAIDSYLKAHPTLSEHERKRLCRVMDCQKLSLDACMHAAQNERLPLRIVVQVLFSEQIKITNAIASNGVSMAKDTQNFYSQPNRGSVLENLPQSFQEGWSTAKKDINTVKFEMENIRSKFTQLQMEFDNLNNQFEKLSKQKNVSAWSTGWKKLSKLKQTSIFQTKTAIHDTGPQMDSTPHVRAEKQRRWRNSIS
ncbi:hypothetical protein SUGI_0183490 [Cryptomeria japonica]|uniref:root phototropism protein 3 n=1 Tax=Cryptomeria japonica TaxID=3369 RepID=UPI002408C320|nr:root phototropism protein 3 [Cryptomeria japonica]GLJ12078.1 hypothetical protein SUGI_0183490 [Cryptomeria japonica]